MRQVLALPHAVAHPIAQLHLHPGHGCFYSPFFGTVVHLALMQLRISMR